MTRSEYDDIPPGWDNPEAYWSWKESRQESCFHAELAGLDVRGDAHYTGFQPLGLENDEGTHDMGGSTHQPESTTDAEVLAEATTDATEASAPAEDDAEES